MLEPDQSMFRDYLRMIRVHIVFGGILAFTLGSLLAVADGGVFEPVRFVVCYAIVFLGDLSTHFSNDYFDVKTDKLISNKTFFTGSKVLLKNPVLIHSARTISVGLLSASLLLSTLAVIAKMATVELLLVMLVANFLGWFYSAPPLRLVSRGLGEVAIALATGFAIPAVGYLAVKGQLDGWFGLFALPFVLYGFMLALSLEAPDVEVDRLGDKKTFGVMKGVNAVFGLIFALAFTDTLLFFTFSWHIIAAVNFWVVAAFSAVPLVAGLLSFVCYCYGRKSQIFSAISVLSLIVFNVLMIIYLLL
jgi:1,4-dihydroxy-2-naphthoate polyprenyltransferase